MVRRTANFSAMRRTYIRYPLSVIGYQLSVISYRLYLATRSSSLVTSNSIYSSLPSMMLITLLASLTSMPS